ncbi:hypothetical protein M501DRAFT_993869 [Patellaria atrata CBS 101060]|uniref:Uncharacterized protein n=1 Tax=Patellaria atrata CBS 101060 TaxID=1346257 RepID=A0A9P4VWT1_9PEZI|nr:hypothetical protein M501DRAFT_993869 [Patellaria atrata CBS 101060]
MEGYREYHLLADRKISLEEHLVYYESVHAPSAIVLIWRGGIPIVLFISYPFERM